MMTVKPREYVYEAAEWKVSAAEVTWSFSKWVRQSRSMCSTSVSY